MAARRWELHRARLVIACGVLQGTICQGLAKSENENITKPKFVPTKTSFEIGKQQFATVV